MLNPWASAGTETDRANAEVVLVLTATWRGERAQSSQAMAGSAVVAEERIK